MGGRGRPIAYTIATTETSGTAACTALTSAAYPSCSTWMKALLSLF